MVRLTEEEFMKKYNLYSQELMNISYGYTRNKEDSLDVIQNVFYKYFNYNKSFPNLNEEKYWLIRVNINECKDLWKRKSKATVLDEKTIDYLSQKKETNVINSKLIELSEKVNKLPQKYRVVIILFYYDSLSIKEIVEILNISESAVKKRLERGRKILKKEMEVPSC